MKENFKRAIKKSVDMDFGGEWLAQKCVGAFSSNGEDEDE